MDLRRKESAVSTEWQMVTWLLGIVALTQYVVWAVSKPLPLAYGQCTHPAIYQKSDGRWYCTECQQLRA